MHREDEDETTENILEKNKNVKDQIEQLSQKQNLMFVELQKERAEKLLKKQDEIYDGRTKLLIKNGYDKNSEFRTLRAYTGALSSLCGDTEEKSLERVKALSVKPSEATPEQKQAMAKELESVFKVLMDFDLKELNFNSISDVLDEAHERAATMVRFCFSGAKLFDYYEELIKDEDYVRFAGRQVEVRTYEKICGSREHAGELRGKKDGVVTVVTEDGELEIPADKISKINLAVVF